MKTKYIIVIAGIVLFLAWKKKQTVSKPIAKQFDSYGRPTTTEVA